MNKDIITVIKSINYSEADKVLTVFGREYGKFTIFAKGIRKINSKNRGNMQTLCTSQIAFYEGKGLPVLTESSSVSSLNFDKLEVANIGRILFMLNKFLQDYDPYPKLFDALQIALNKDLVLDVTNKLRIKFLMEMGFLEDFSSCKYCDKKENLDYLDPYNFFLICKDCHKEKGGKALGDNPYSSLVLTTALDRYVRKVVEEI
jgi:DNA repair protein RecO (recombination protein O)